MVFRKVHGVGLFGEGVGIGGTGGEVRSMDE